MKFHTLFFPMHLLGFLVFGASLAAQVRVTFIVHELSAQKHDSIYISGSFNQDNKTYLLKPTETGRKKIVLDLPPGPIQYKFTRGNWNTVEMDPFGLDIDSRLLLVRKDTTVFITIANWRDEIGEMVSIEPQPQPFRPRVTSQKASKVTFIVYELSEAKHDSIYISGSFNQ